MVETDRPNLLVHSSKRDPHQLTECRHHFGGTAYQLCYRIVCENIVPICNVASCHSVWVDQCLQANYFRLCKDHLGIPCWKKNEFCSEIYKTPHKLNFRNSTPHLVNITLTMPEKLRKKYLATMFNRFHSYFSRRKQLSTYHVCGDQFPISCNQILL